MSDHVHLLLEGQSHSSDLRRVVKDAKQRTGYWFRHQFHEQLWAASFYDHVLRNEEATIPAVRYILANPLRAGLSRVLVEYPFAGSDVYSLEEICGCLQMWRPPYRRRSESSLR